MHKSIYLARCLLIKRRQKFDQFISAHMTTQGLMHIIEGVAGEKCSRIAIISVWLSICYGETVFFFKRHALNSNQKERLFGLEIEPHVCN